MFKKGCIFFPWGLTLFIVFSPFVSGIEYPSTFIFTSVLLLGIGKSRWLANLRNEVFLLLTMGFFLRLPSDDFCFLLWGGSGWLPDGGYRLGQFFCSAVTGISFVLAFYNGAFLFDRKIVIPKDLSYWMMWATGMAFFAYSYFVAGASFATFFLYALPSALVERRRSVIYLSNIWTLGALVAAPIIIWKISGQIHDSFCFEKTNEIFFGSLAESLNANCWLRALFLIPWILMIWVQTKNTILNKNILYGKKAER